GWPPCRSVAPLHPAPPALHARNGTAAVLTRLLPNFSVSLPGAEATGRVVYPFHTATPLPRRAWLARWAADAPETPAAAGAAGRRRLRPPSTQSVRCTSSPLGWS